MKYFRKLILITFFLNSFVSLKAQGIKEVLQSFTWIQLDVPFKKDTTHLRQDPDKYSLQSGSYLLPYTIKTIYGRPIEKVLLVAYEDTARAICIFLPFDSLLHKRMEEELGPYEAGWMAFEPGETDTTGMILNRRWILTDHIVSFACTRYISLRGEKNEDDRIRIIISKRRNSANERK